MSQNISVCNNKYCEEYKNNSCSRATAHKRAIRERDTYVSYITNRNNESSCELFLDNKRDSKTKG